MTFLFCIRARAERVCLHLLWSFTHANPGRPFLLVWACWRGLAQDPGVGLSSGPGHCSGLGVLGRFLTGIRGCRFAIKNDGVSRHCST